MNNSKIISILAILLTAIMISGGITVSADTLWPPKPFELWSEDRTMVFRWNPILDEFRSAEVAHASMYRNGERIWFRDDLPADGVSDASFHFSKDFRYMVFSPTADKIAAFGFFENGVLIRSYRIDELVRNMTGVGYTSSSALWDNWIARNFDPINNTFSIITIDGITYVFDITTGKIIYDTAGDRLFIPHRENTREFYINEGPLPLWAQKTTSSWIQESIERTSDLVLPLMLAIIAVPLVLRMRVDKRQGRGFVNVH